jgi:short-subunit dehydrogenase/acyl carrier protein
MAARGARNLVLAGRSEPSRAALDEIASFQAGGASVRIVTADVATEDGVREMLRAATSTGRPLRGVVHAAGVLADGVLGEQRWEDFERVLAAKVTGTSLLDTLTREHPVEHFILFSSVASVMGSAGQGAYAAANAFMDGLALRRRALGLPAQSINWGPWADRGMAAGMSRRDRDRFSATGFEMMPTDDALGCLERAIALNLPQVAVIPARWEVVCGRFVAGQVPPLLRLLGAQRPRQAMPSAGKNADLLRPRLDRAPDSEKPGVIVAFVRDQVAKALGLTSSGALALRTPFTDLGLDSLMAVELRNGLAEAAALELRASLIYDHPCIEELATYISGALLGAGTGASAVRDEDSQEPWQAMADDLDDLSDQELAGLLSAGMASLKLEDR